LSSGKSLFNPITRNVKSETIYTINYTLKIIISFNTITRNLKSATKERVHFQCWKQIRSNKKYHELFVNKQKEVKRSRDDADNEHKKLISAMKDKKELQNKMRVL
jgi:hypothetical protein